MFNLPSYNTMETKQIFISYSSKDQDIAYKICSLLEGENMTCWIAPRDVTGGKSYGREILEAISNAQVVLFIFSENSNRSRHVENEIDNAFGAIDAMLQKRYDLLPNLVETVRQYASHEKQTLTQLTELRGHAGYSTLDASAKAQFDRQFTAATHTLMATVENYPELKASDNFLHLQRTLNETEEQLSAARRTYNAVVTAYNNSVQTFPSSLIASFFGFTPRPVLDLPQEQRAVPNTHQLFDR